jgi:hypothetical protein
LEKEQHVVREPGRYGVQPRSLREDLLAIDGVEGADVDGLTDAPSGLRIRISQNADQTLVGQAIRRVLSDHGLGTDTTLPGEASVRVRDPGTSVASVSDIASDEVEPASVTTLLSVDEDDDGMEIIDLVDDPVIGGGRAAGVDSEAVEAAAIPELVIARIERVSVQEGRRGILVTVEATDGRIEKIIARTADGGVDRAVVLAAARLAAPGAPDPLIVEIEERRVEGVDIVMIVLDRDGEMAAGSAVVVAGSAFALGRATWAAVSV